MNVRHVAIVVLLGVLLGTGCANTGAAREPDGPLLTVRQVRAALASSGAKEIETQHPSRFPFPMVIASYMQAGNCECPAASVAVAVVDSDDFANGMLAGARDSARTDPRSKAYQVVRVLQERNLVVWYFGDPQHVNLAVRTLRAI
jgi:hypothetical protein